ncbi:O-antigen ligase family protein [Velocimicrobium porci]|uniref:O-antigen ligase family protein n=1 Tax=Velocimicrobium porci TaxID=2606634 RepID=A0A6L5Y298_9FIRM|nr:O-antigen ligase family protein [Velocimicrobium porci]MSS64488.1 O-antigen ligase family protein [Velocimicrobium porci]
MSYNKKRQKYKSASQKNYFLFPLILIPFIPLIMYYHEYNNHLSEFPWSGSETSADIFLYWKMVVFTTIGVVMACILIYKISSDKKFQKNCLSVKTNTIWIPLLIYGILSILSTVFSEYSYFGYHGMTEQMESLWVLLSYCILAYYTYLFVQTEQDVKTIIKWLLIGAGILCLIGMFQAFSLDFYRSSLGRSLYLPSELSKSDSIQFTFPDGQVYTSLYNPNYVGVYASLFIPLLIILILFNKNRKSLFAYIPLSITVIICLFGSKSKTGLIAIIVSLLFMLLLFRKTIFKYWKLFGGILAVLCVSFFAYNAITDNQLITSIQFALQNVKNAEKPLNQIQTNDDNVMIEYNHQKLYFSFNPNGENIASQLVLKDENGKTISSTLKDDTVGLQVTDERFATFSVSVMNSDNTLYFNINIDGQDWYFTNQLGDNTYYYLSNTGKTCKIKNPETAVFDSEHESFATGRGYIWSRTIPLLKNTLILGTGADTFLLEFPNDDFVGRYNNDCLTALISKPHNMYLQIGVQTGVLSLIAFLAFYVIYFVSSIKLYFKHSFDTYLSQIGASILVGTLGYMVAGLANDSSITLAPVFWLLIGLGIAVNTMVKKEQLS